MKLGDKHKGNKVEKIIKYFFMNQKKNMGADPLF
jgi:hypothetical protein